MVRLFTERETRGIVWAVRTWRKDAEEQCSNYQELCNLVETSEKKMSGLDADLDGSPPRGGDNGDRSRTRRRRRRWRLRRRDDGGRLSPLSGGGSCPPWPAGRGDAACLTAGNRIER